MPMWRPIHLLMIATAMTVTTGPAKATGGDKCFANWSEAATIVRKEALVEVEKVSTLASSHMAGAEVVKTTLCREDGRYVYRLVVREAKGQMRTVSVDARRPFRN